MGSFLFFAFSWWSIALRIVAIIHFIRRRPNFFWIWVILFSWIGALVYIVFEVIPDAGLLRSSFQVFPRWRRIQELERAILDNPSAGNYEELGLLYLDDGKYAQARAAMTKRFPRDRTPWMRSTGVASRRLNSATSQRPCLTWSTRLYLIPITTFTAPRDCWRGLTRRPGRTKKRTRCFARHVRISTISETYYYYALFLQSQGRAAEAREWSQKILDKRPTMPGYLRRRERPWFRKASALLARLPAA